MTVERVGVLGSGQMGAGIAHLAARSGCRVDLADLNLELAEKGKAGIAKRLAKAVEKGKIGQADMDGILSRITPVASLEALSEAELVIEAATEKVDLKIDLFKRLDKAMTPGAVLATNTSSISITLLAGATTRPEEVVGMHFMNPAPVMELVELIPGLQTAPKTLTLAKTTAEAWGKTTAESRDFPGFIVNRLLIPYLNEACSALMEGVGTVEDIDTAIKLGLAHPMGPFQLADLIGLDTVLAISRVLFDGYSDPKYRPNALLIKYVEAGWLGRKTGRGFYSY